MSRILNLPKRDWEAEEKAGRWAERLTDLLKTPHGTQRLRPVQAAALWEFDLCQALIGNIRTGGGKTLIANLLPNVLGSLRPLMVMPAHLVDEKEAEREELRLHWQISRNIRVESFSAVSQLKNADLLDLYKPDLLIFDEAHKLKHQYKSACAKRVRRYIEQNPGVPKAFFSATFKRISLQDYGHIVEWALGEGSPLPRSPEVRKDWALALDAGVPMQRRRPVSVLVDLGNFKDISEARVALKDRFAATPGVIVSKGSFVGSGLEVESKCFDIGLEREFEELRTLAVAPDGWDLGYKQFGVWDVARQLALGFFYQPDPRPPEPWLKAYRAYCKLVRQILEGDDWDSELQVRLAFEKGLGSGGVYEAWKEIEPTFEINTRPVWLSDKAVEQAAEWGNKRGRKSGLIWCEHIAFAKRLAKLTGWKYYAENGQCTKTKKSVANSKNEIAILAVKANVEGRNLQQFHENLIVSPHPDPSLNEQLVARTHRDGQLKDCVSVEMHMRCIEHIEALDKVRMHAKAHEQEFFAQKMGIATIREAEPLLGWAWRKK